jgi:hypothetical protein
MLWVGLDLHKHYITACAMDEQGAIVAEHRRLPADDATLLGWLSALPGPVTVAMEATLYWAWLHDRLTVAGYAAVAAHPYQVKLIWQARCKTDPIDARKLAELGDPGCSRRSGCRMPKRGLGGSCCGAGPIWCGCGHGSRTGSTATSRRRIAAAW